MEIKFEKFLDVSRLLIDQNSIKDYICSLCNGIIKQPRQDCCGHIFCKSCIILYVSNFKNTCPVTKEKLVREDFIEIKFVENILNKIQTNCKHEGCIWTGLFQDLDNHLEKDCVERSFVCPNQGCKYEGKKIFIKCHLDFCLYREVLCDFCKEYYRFNFNHLIVCKNSVIDCKQNCGIQFKKNDEEDHLSTCVMTEVDCPFNKYGCEERVLKRDLKNHLKDTSENHLILVLEFSNKNIELLNNRIRALEEFDNEQKSKIKELEQNYKKQKLDSMKNIYISIEKANQNPNLLARKQNRLEDKEKVIKEIKNSKKEEEKKNDNEKKMDDEKKIDDEQIIKRDKNKNQPSLSPANPQEIKNYKFFFDLNTLHEDLKIDNNKIIALNNSKKNGHRFVFADINVSSVEFSWKIIIKKVSKWLGFGLCQKEKVIRNNYLFYNGNEFDHGLFCYSSNGYSWNSNIFEEDNYTLKDFKTLKSNDIIFLNFKPKQNLLFFKINEFSGKLRNVKSDGYSLVPCFIFLNGEDEVLVESI